MAKYMLVSFETCPWVQRSAIVLREKNAGFELRHIDPDNRPDWFLAISPHKKVPVLRIDDSISLFESNAINEYLDESIEPRLHPEDPIGRAVNRAWTDYVPTFAGAVTATAYAETEAEYNKAIEGIPVPFERLERALEKQGGGPFFNGAKYSLVDAAYAPFLQRYLPFWLAVFASRLLVLLIPIVGIAYPLLRLAPALYGWSMRRRIFSLYGELKFIEAELDTGGPRAQADAAARLQRLEERADRLRMPNSFAHFLYQLRSHIALVRGRLPSG